MTRPSTPGAQIRVYGGEGGASTGGDGGAGKSGTAKATACSTGRAAAAVAQPARVAMAATPWARIPRLAPAPSYASASATTTAVGHNAYAAAFQTGGNAGLGQDYAAAGLAAPSTLVNAVTGATNGGRLYLKQVAKAGSGNDTYGGAPSAGAAALSSLTFDDLTSATRSAGVYGYVLAYGGRGTLGQSGSAGGAGGQANASETLTGPGAVTAVTFAQGGAGRGGASYGAGGGGKALTFAYGTAVTSAGKKKRRPASGRSHARLRLLTTHPALASAVATRRPRPSPEGPAAISRRRPAHRRSPAS